MDSILLFCMCFLIGITALPLIRRSDWWIRFCDFPRVQILVFQIALFTIYVSMYSLDTVVEWIVLSLLVCAFLFQCYRIYPYTPLHHMQSLVSERDEPERKFSLIVANIEMGNRNAEIFKQLIRESDPDFIFAAETDAWWTNQLSFLEDEYPHKVLQPQDNFYGFNFYSRLPLKDTTVQYYVMDDIPSLHTLIQLRNGDWIEFFGLHPRPPEVYSSSVQRDAELVVVARKIRHKEHPIVVAGDLNDVAWSYTTRLFQEISGMLDPRVGRGFYNTFDARRWYLRYPLDHVFHTRDFRLVELRILPFIGSDHFPVFVRLSHEPEITHEQVLLTPDEEDLEHARQILERTRELE
ncbi:MAG: endonuclease/exonuclease/phosphatase family protein [bacterium]